MNAELRQKDADSDNLKEIIRKFKEDHLQLIERIRQIDRSNIRTDSSANYSDNNATRQSSLTKVNKSVYSNTNIPFFEQRQRNNTFRTPPQVKPVIICNASDGDTENFNGHNTYSAQSPAEIRSNTDNNKTLRSTVVFSTSADDENEHSNERNYASVKSSNELLTSVMNIGNDESINEAREDTKNISNNDIASVGMETSNNEAHILANDCNNNISDNKIDGNDNLQSDKENYIDLIDSSSESNIAEALTQFIESADESHVDKTSEEMETDEELAQETVNEINEVLAREISIDSVILTPPMDFRD